MNIAYYVSNESACEPKYFTRLKDAKEFAIANNYDYIERHILSYDAFCRAYNGDGGFVLSSKEVWRKV